MDGPFTDGGYSISQDDRHGEGEADEEVQGGTEPRVETMKPPVPSLDIFTSVCHGVVQPVGVLDVGDGTIWRSFEKPWSHS